MISFGETNVVSSSSASSPKTPPEDDICSSPPPPPPPSILPFVLSLSLSSSIVVVVLVEAVSAEAAISSATSIISRTSSRTISSFSFEPLFSSSLAISRILLYSSGVNADVLVLVVVTVVVVVVFVFFFSLLLNSSSTSLGDKDVDLMRSNSPSPMSSLSPLSSPLFLFLSSIACAMLLVATPDDGDMSTTGDMTFAVDGVIRKNVAAKFHNNVITSGIALPKITANLHLLFSWCNFVHTTGTTK